MSERFDIICVGAGSVGMPLAIQAAQRGVRILQLEADSRVGGTLHYSAGQLSSAGSRLQRAHDIEDSPAEHAADAQRIAHGSIDPDLLRLFTENSAEVIDWLLDLGFEPAPGMPVAANYHSPYRTRRYFWGNNQALSVLEALQPTYDKLVSSGAIDLRLNRRLTQLVRSEDGAVTGVVVESPEGKRETYFGRNVVLATGGYAGSPEAWAKLGPNKLTASHCNPFSRGEGIFAAQAAGAAVDGSEKFCATFAGILDNPADPRTGLFLDFDLKKRSTWEIFVNHEGRRFMREDHPSIDYRERQLLKQPGLAMTIVFDKGIMQNAPPITALPDDVFKAKFGKQENFLVANTLEDLARQIGVDPATLTDTVNRYNSYVDQGEDPEFGRDFLVRRIEKPPFYAMRAVGITVVSPAGVAVDGNLRVLTPERKPIPNLYAAGEVIGFTRISGNTFVGGLSLTPALTFGYLLGKTLK